MTKLYDLLILAHQHQNENSTHYFLYMSYATNKGNLLNDRKIICLLSNHYWENFSCKGLTLYTICTEAYIYSCILKLITDRSLRDVFFTLSRAWDRKKIGIFMKNRISNPQTPLRFQTGVRNLSSSHACKKKGNHRELNNFFVSFKTDPVKKSIRAIFN